LLEGQSIMATTHPPRSQQLTVASFDSLQRAATVIDRLIDAGHPENQLGLLMTDRTAARQLAPPTARDELGTAGRHSDAVNRLARALSPVAALGSPGTGLLATGPLAAALVSAGLGSALGLRGALQQLGVSSDVAREVVRHVDNGAVLLGALLEERPPKWAALVEHESVLVFSLEPATDDSPRAVVTRPAAAAGDQRASYEPLIESPDPALGSRAGANRIGS
jgi:hypothetical protein